MSSKDRCVHLQEMCNAYVCGRLQLQECTFKIIMARYMFALVILDIIIDISGIDR